ncbi:proteoglycan 4 [Acyrthosiphon pisum]|uniref:Uncharacterized protein n=1 Tax=Acyrthosiphon pisum TaxID=7029 RepID=A0A8R1W0U0_ACYPI|nr:proteoglycan 4 [Acyrthosiphon pisum]|eukprot:XP_001947665.2 PREDICTED: proteoglycan 4-like [Acyrthosiphon pisum]
MHLNIFVVSLFAVVMILQIANGLPTRRFDTNHINEDQKLNGNNRFMIPSNNIMPFKIQATQTKNRPPAYGPSEPSSSQSPLTQQTSDWSPTSETNPKMETAPTSVTDPKMETAPTSATDPKMETAPKSATNPSMETAPTSVTDTKIETAPTSATTPRSETPPTAMTKPTPHNY